MKKFALAIAVLLSSAATASALETDDYGFPIWSTHTPTTTQFGTRPVGFFRAQLQPLSYVYTNSNSQAVATTTQFNPTATQPVADSGTQTQMQTQSETQAQPQTTYVRFQSYPSYGQQQTRPVLSRARTLNVSRFFGN